MNKVRMITNLSIIHRLFSVNVWLGRPEESCMRREGRKLKCAIIIVMLLIIILIMIIIVIIISSSTSIISIV